MAPLSILPGRLRIECEGIRGQRGICRALEKRIGALSGVLEASANFRTGRLLVQFDETVIGRPLLSERIEALLKAPESCADSDCPQAGPPSARREPVPSPARSLFLDLVAHAVLPKPLDLLVPAISALRR